MIHSIFPTNILIEDIDFTDEEISEMSFAINAIFKSHEAITGSHVISGEDSMPLFTDENITVFPILKKLKKIFADGFYKLADKLESINRMPTDAYQFWLIRTCEAISACTEVSVIGPILSLYTPSERPNFLGNDVFKKSE